MSGGLKCALVVVAAMLGGLLALVGWMSCLMLGVPLALAVFVVSVPLALWWTYWSYRAQGLPMPWESNK